MAAPTTWSDLPMDLLGIVCMKLTVIFDFAAFGAVCSHWRFAFFQCKPPQVPLLMLPQESGKHTVFSSPDFSDKHVLHSKQTVPTCYGSSYGWLITKGLGKGTLQLLNPFSAVNNVIQLPVPCPDSGIFLNKAILSNDPSETSNYSVAVLGRCLGLSFFRAGDTSWTSINDQHELVDIAYYKDHIYGISPLHELIISFDINATIPSVTVVASLPWIESEQSKHLHLVVSAEDLLCVKLLSEDFRRNIIGRQVSGCQFFECQVFKLGTRKLEKLENLKGHTILISKLSCVSVSASELSNCNPDHIYFSYSYTSRGKCHTKVVNFTDKTIWLLEGRKFNTLPLKFSSSGGQGRSVWVQPTLSLLTSTTRNEESPGSS